MPDICKLLNYVPCYMFTVRKRNSRIRNSRTMKHIISCHCNLIDARKCALQLHT